MKRMTDCQRFETPFKCSKSCQTALVTGYRGDKSKEKVRERGRTAIWTLHSYLFNLPPSSKPHAPIHVVVNDCSPFQAGWSEDNLREIHELLTNMPVEDGITLIFFAHSYGANLLNQALKPDVLQKYLTSQKLSPTDLQVKISTIRDHLAVFTLGGTEEISEELAELPRNVILKSDRKSKMLKVFLAEGSGKSFVEVDVSDSIPKMKRKKSRKCLHLWESASASSHSDGVHFLSQYTDSEIVMEKIRLILGVKKLNEIQ